MFESTRIEEDRIRSAYAKREDGDRYSLFRPGTLFIAQQMERRMLETMRRTGVAELASKRILEVGCGTGHWLREFTKWGSRVENVWGIDLLRDRLSKARASCSPEIRLQCGSAAELPFPDATFDLVLQSTLFTSILDPDLKRRAAAEMMRVVTQEGIILWYDSHVNNPWNRDVRGVKRSEIRKLFPGCRIELQRLTLLPPLARWLAPYSLLACYILEKLPPLCTHYLGVIRKV
jgi:ubiquinone/menaquinone biosynthesis C-methylase UbiE